MTANFDLIKMDAGTILGYGIIRPKRRFKAIVAPVIVAPFIVACGLCVLSGAQSAHAAVFNPSTPTELVDAFATAGANAEDDIIDLGWHTFELTDELFLKPDDGHSLELRNGTLERSEDSEPFRLLNLLEVPESVLHDGLPVLIEDVQFKNGLFRSDDLDSDSDAGGGALLSHRNTLINNALFVNNRLEGPGSGGAIKHSKFLEISKVRFENNQASGINDFQLSQGGAIAAEAGARLLVGNGDFLGNVADRGGAIYAANEVIDLSVTRSVFDGNQAQSNGGAIWSDISEGGIRITNSSFVANRAPLGGAAFYSQTLNSNITLIHITMWGNESDPGMGAGIRTLEPISDSSFFLRNSILTNNAGGNCSGIEQSSLQISFESHNVIDDTTCGLLGNNVLTGTVSEYSDTLTFYGSIPAIPVEIASQARNLVPRVNCSSHDSRDIPRLDNGLIPDSHCDAGAFEYEAQEYIDMDGDNIGNRADNCVRVSNPLQSDIDGDGLGDECDRRDDRDSDKDVVLNFQDNCPGQSNFLQLDRNGNGIGDACEQISVHSTLAPIIR